MTEPLIRKRSPAEVLAYIAEKLREQPDATALLGHSFTLDMLAEELAAESVERRAEELAEATRLRSMNFRDGKLELELESAHEITTALVASARTILADAENYTELTFEVAADGERYVLTLQRPGKLTPHEARVKAEAERDALRAELHLLAARRQPAAEESADA